MASNRRGKYSKPPYKYSYGIWAAMKQRCANPKSQVYANYGGRGITVCEEWLSFENFYRDMGPKPDGMSIDRIDNNGDYEPSNCRWATPHEQNVNQRRYKMGISYRADRSHWRIYVSSKYKGSYPTYEAALEARLAMA